MNDKSNNTAFRHLEQRGRAYLSAKTHQRTDVGAIEAVAGIHVPARIAVGNPIQG